MNIEWWQAFILALIQGITEFLPISSSAHLILPSQLLGWPDQGLAFDVAVHLGSLVAVMAYFRQDLSNLAVGGIRTLGGDWSEAGKLAWCLVLATVPAGLAGLLLDDLIEKQLRSTLVIAITTILGAVLLAIADRWNRGHWQIADITWKAALMIGLAQALALIPGTSRSGITITMALLLGFQPVAAARFSFLLAIPVILLSAGWKAVGLSQLEQVIWGPLFLAMLTAAISAYLCISLFLSAIERMGMIPFVIYRLGLGIGLLVLV